MRTITFYSYKGGVGRSLLVGWAARALARAGQSVVALDLDLEAPGLHHKLEPVDGPDTVPRGFVDLLRAFQQGAQPPETLADFTVPVAPGAEETGTIRLMAAGAAPRDAYWSALAAISWEELFFGAEPAGVPFFAWLRARIESDLAPDFLLVDARTGVTEMGGAALTLLADDIVALFAHNAESKEGVRAVLRSVQRAPRPDKRPPPRMMGVVTRIPQELPADEEEAMRSGLKAYMEEPVDQLAATPELIDLRVVHSESSLAIDETLLKTEPTRFRVARDFEALLHALLPDLVDPPEAGDAPPARATPPSSDDALAILRSNVALYRDLAQRQPEAHLPRLAASLKNLARWVASAGRHQEALQAELEASGIFRELAARAPDVYEPDLAMGLSNLGLRLSEFGRRAEALAPSEEAVRIARRLAERAPDTYEPVLAGSLNSLGALLLEVGRQAEALGLTQEALNIHRRLAERAPDTYEADLGGGLNNLGILLSALGRKTEALEPTEDAVRIHRRLAARAPDAYEPVLAMSLNNLGNLLSELGRSSDALQPTQEALLIRRRLAKRDPDAYEPVLAMSLNNLGNLLSELGRSSDALQPVEEAVHIYRQLAMRTPDLYQPDLAMSLLNLGALLPELDRGAEALPPTEEAVQLYRGLSARVPDAYEPALADSLNNLGALLSELGRTAEALEPAAEAVRRLLPHFERSPLAFEGRMMKMARGYEALASEAGVEPDSELQARLVAVAERMADPK